MARILYITSGLGVGGAETMLVRLAGGLKRRGHSQHIVSLSGHDDRLARHLVEDGIGVDDLKLGIRRWSALPSMMMLRHFAMRFAPDIIQGWMYHGNVAATLIHLSLGRRRTRRLCWSLRASNMDHDRYGGVIRWNARLSRWADRIIVNSRTGAEFHTEQGFDSGRFAVVPNGIDTDRFRPDVALRLSLRQALGIAEDTPVALHVARVDPMKDHVGFLRAMEMNPGITGVLVGAGTEDLALPPNVRALGVRSELEHLYPLADIVVSSSAFGEGFSNTIAEGMSCGLVPVATDVGDARDIIGSAGSIVTPRDINALARALGDVAGLPREERTRLAAQARSRIIGQFSIEKAVMEYEAIYS